MDDPFEDAIMSHYDQYVEVFISGGIPKGLDYGVPTGHTELKKGSLVQVTVRGRLINGLVLSVKKSSPYKRVLPIQRVLSSESLINDKRLQLAIWMAEYYQTDLGRVLKFFLPTEVRKHMGHKEQLFVSRSKSLSELKNFCEEMRAKKPKQVAVLDQMLKVEKGLFISELIEKSGSTRGVIQTLIKNKWLQASSEKIERNPLAGAEYFKAKPKKLNEEQNEALKALTSSIDKSVFDPFLLYGVTGSGKTEVYMQAIEHVLQKGKKALLLVPEIALTTQTIERFKSRFDCPIAILHHRLSAGERFDQWHRIRKGEVSIVIGPRSAIFAPLDSLGLILVDEEHENSYKQTEEMPTYHARDVAVMRAKLESCSICLGSATPSFESYTNAQKGKYQLIELTQRATSQNLSHIQLVDMKTEYEKAKGFTNFSDQLLRSIKDRYEKGEQSILFLNRRGYHTSLVCAGCSETVSCPHCDCSLTFYLKTKQCMCHLCDYVINSPKYCPKCKEPTIQYKGVGTEKIEQQLKNMFPHMRVLRLDGETTRHKGSYEKIYYQFRNQKADILIGTQMIAKGLDFPNVTLVGVLNGDSQINLPDFRASEFAFQLLTQVAGRAGRGNQSGEVLIQTLNPDNPVLQLALKQDYSLFYETEIQSRQLFQFPPFIQLAKIVFQGPKEDQVLKFAEGVQRNLNHKSRNTFHVGLVMPCGHPKIKENYRFQFLIKSPSIKKVSEALKELKAEIKLPTNLKMLIDVNPSSTFF